MGPFEVDVFKRIYVKPWPLELITLSYATPNYVELLYAEKLIRISSNKLHGPVIPYHPLAVDTKMLTNSHSMTCPYETSMQANALYYVVDNNRARFIQI